ncbi:MAG: hypothetical protein NTZ89_01525 [Actinobacteria bacterium]|nr:hypothetical protein [Actinomycetota bacterium]
MKKELNIVIKTGIYLLTAMAVITTVDYIIFGLKNIDNFISIVIAEALSFILFFASIIIYNILSGKEASTAVKFIVLSFMGKLLLIAGIFFLLIKTGSINLLYFFVSFVIFFTILLNVEIYLLYKKILFKK